MGSSLRSSFYRQPEEALIFSGTCYFFPVMDRTYLFMHRWYELYPDSLVPAAAGCFMAAGKAACAENRGQPGYPETANRDESCLQT